MIYRLFPQKDTFITNARVNSVPMTASNAGASQILQLFKLSGSMHPDDDVSRILMKFDVTPLSGLIGSYTGSVVSMLDLKDAQHDQTLPTSYDVEIASVTQDWDEGAGFDVDRYSDTGFANWVQPKSTMYWTSTGSVTTGSIVTYHFDTGHEDLVSDVSSLVADWYSGRVTNNGLVVKLSSTLENNDQDYYIKMFHARNTHFTDSVPSLDVYWDDSSSGTLAVSQSIDPVGPYFVNVRNLKTEYESDEVVKFHLYVRPWDYNPAVVLTSSYDMSGSVITEAYYRVTNDRTNAVWVPFSTGSLKFSKLSYDSTGDFFWFYMNTLPPKNVYRLAFLFCVGGQKYFIDNSFKFRVT